MRKAKHVVGLDIGTSQVKAVVASQGETSNMECWGVGTSPTVGMQKGSVGNVKEVAKSIKRALHEAQNASGLTVRSVFAGGGGSNCEGLNNHGMICFLGKDNEPILQEITEKEVGMVLGYARAVAFPPERTVLEVIPSGYSINGRNGISKPVGLWAMRLEAKVHIITADISCLLNLQKSIELAGYEVEKFVFETNAVSPLLLSPEERQQGVALIDLGSETIKLAIFYEGFICHSAVFPYGSHHATKDVAECLALPFEEAERLKISYGLERVPDQEESLLGPLSSWEKGEPVYVERRYLSKIIDLRFLELLEWAEGQLRGRPMWGNLPAGVVLTGGGALMKGVVEVARRVLRCPVRLATLKEVVKGRSLVEPAENLHLYNALGLAHYGLRYRRLKPEKKTFQGKLLNMVEKSLEFIMSL